MTAVRPVGVDPYYQYIANTSGIGPASTAAASVAAVDRAGSIVSGSQIPVPGAATAGHIPAQGTGEKAGVGELAVATGKGIVKGALRVLAGIGDILTDPKKLALTAATVGACFIPGVGPFVAAGLLAYGTVTNGGGILQGISDWGTGILDGNAKQAEEGMAGTFSNSIGLGLAAYGVRGIGRAQFNANGAMPVTVGNRLITSADQVGVGTAIRMQGSQLWNTARGWWNGGLNNASLSSVWNRVSSARPGQSLQTVYQDTRTRFTDTANAGTEQATVRTIQNHNPARVDLARDLRHAERTVARLEGRQQAGRTINQADLNSARADVTRLSGELGAIDGRLAGFRGKFEARQQRLQQNMTNLHNEAASRRYDDLVASNGGAPPAGVTQPQNYVQNSRAMADIEANIAQVNTKLQPATFRNQLIQQRNTAQNAGNQVRVGTLNEKIAATYQPGAMSRTYHTLRVHGQNNPGLYPGLGSTMIAHNPFAGSYEEKLQRGELG